MGITGLIPQLKPIKVSKNIKDFEGQTCGIDAYSWLHKGSYGCAREIVLNIPTYKLYDCPHIYTYIHSQHTITIDVKNLVNIYHFFCYNSRNNVHF